MALRPRPASGARVRGCLPRRPTMRFPTVLCTLVLALIASAAMGCRTPYPDAPEAQIRALLASLEAADRASDVEAIVACYHPDAVLHLPGGGLARGRSEIRKRYAAGLATFQLDVTIDIDELQVTGDQAVCWGTTHGRFVWSDGRPPAAFRDAYVLIVQREPRSPWRIRHLAWRPDVPPGEQALAPAP